MQAARIEERYTCGWECPGVLTRRLPCRAQKRLLLLDYDGTLVPQSTINSRPTEEALSVLKGLCADPRNAVYIISGRRKAELAEWFAGVVSVLCPCLAVRTGQAKSLTWQA